MVVAVVVITRILIKNNMNNISNFSKTWLVLRNSFRLKSAPTATDIYKDLLLIHINIFGTIKNDRIDLHWLSRHFKRHKCLRQPQNVTT